MHAGQLAEHDLLRGLADQLASAAHGTRGPLVQRAMQLLGCSRDALYRKLHSVGWHSKRRPRSDKHDSRVTVAEVEVVAGIHLASAKATGKINLPLTDAIDIALANGKLRERVSPSTMSRLMRRHGCHPSQLQRPSAHVPMRSLHPNHVWQLDASICVLYYLRNGQMGVLDERIYNKRKPANLARILPDRVLRYAITDHRSGVVIARYYQAAGEDQHTLFQFLMWAMHEQPGRVMHGVPWMLVWDAGSANQSHGIRNLLDNLTIRHWAHVPGNSRAKGQVECIHNVIERKFEGRLSFQPIHSVEALNAHLDTWLSWFNGVAELRRGSHRHVRNAKWQQEIRTETLRLCPPTDECALLMTSRPVERKVSGQLTVLFAPKGGASGSYDVSQVPGVRAGEKVNVVASVYRAPNIFVVAKDESGSTRYFECERMDQDAAGLFHGAAVFGESYKAQADSDVDSARKSAHHMAYGETESGKAIDARKKGRVAFNGDIDSFKDVREKAALAPAFMRRPGTTLDVPNPMQVELRPLTLVEILTRLSREPWWSLDVSRAVQTWHPEGLPEDEIPQLLARIEELLAGPSPLPHTPRLVAVR